MNDQVDIYSCDVFLGEFSESEVEIWGCDVFLGEFTDDAEGATGDSPDAPPTTFR
jgi:hypothetical protein